MTRRILVTGANGHLGCSVLRTLVDRGFEVVPYVRASSDTQGIDGLGLAYFRGDILDGEALSKAASGFDDRLRASEVSAPAKAATAMPAWGVALMIEAPRASASSVKTPVPSFMYR